MSVHHQPTALCVSTPVHETSPGYMQGLKKDMDTEPPGMHYNSTGAALGSYENEIKFTDVIHTYYSLRNVLPLLPSDSFHM